MPDCFSAGSCRSCRGRDIDAFVGTMTTRGDVHALAAAAQIASHRGDEDPTNTATGTHVAWMLLPLVGAMTTGTWQAR
jgi:hypothetical protein